MIVIMPEEELNRPLPGGEQTSPEFFTSVQKLDERWLALCPPCRQREIDLLVFPEDVKRSFMFGL